jgi:hypothetical protein
VCSESRCALINGVGSDVHERLYSGVPRNFFSGGGVQQIQLRIEGRENGDLGAVAPQSGVPLNLQMSETRILIRLLWIYFPRNLAQRRTVGGGVQPPNPPSVRHCVYTGLNPN